MRQTQRMPGMAAQAAEAVMVEMLAAPHPAMAVVVAMAVMEAAGYLVVPAVTLATVAVPNQVIRVMMEQRGIRAVRTTPSQRVRVQFKGRDKARDAQWRSVPIINAEDDWSKGLPVFNRKDHQMKRSIGFLISCLMLLCLAQPASAQLPSGGWAVREVRVPHPIHDVHIDACAIWLNLSPEQEHAVRRFRDQYEEQWRTAEMSDEQINEMRKVMEAFDAEYQSAVNYNLAELARKIQAIESQWIAAMREHDARFFAEIESMLTEQQQALLPRLPMWRVRTQEYATQMDLPEAQIDLMNMIRIESDRPYRRFSGRAVQFITLKRSEFLDLLPAIDEYEPALIAALELAAAARRRATVGSRERADHIRLLIDEGLNEATAPEDFEELEKGARRRGRDRMAASLQLERVNRWGLELLAEHLPEEQAAELKRIYNETAYFVVYPDPASAEVLYEKAMAIDSLDDVQREGMIALRDEYRRRHEFLSQRMAEVYREQAAARLSRPRDRNSVIAEHHVSLAKRGWDRDKLNQQQHDLLMMILTEEQSLLLPEWDFDKSPPRRPWWDIARSYYPDSR